MPLSPETRLQAACVKLFHLIYPQHEGRLFLNHNNPRGPKHGHLLRTMGLTPGVADLTLLGNQGAVFIEFKSTKGTQSKTQKLWQQTIEAAGYQYHLVKTVDHFHKILAENLNG